MTSGIVLIVASHPDDEVLGVGGTAAWHAARGDQVEVLILADGVTSRGVDKDLATQEKELSARRGAAVDASRVLGISEPRFGDFPDNRMDACDLLDIVKAVESVTAELEPDIIYTHHGSDLNVDHRLAHQAVLTACRSQPGYKPTAIYTFETVSSTEWGSADIGTAFRPQRFVDISATLERKMLALQCYRMEMRAFPHARSVEAVEALARLRGSQAGCDAAEGFGVIREVIRS
jgi:LmbE family N-acetylglucosaminyl deacetylase